MSSESMQEIMFDEERIPISSLEELRPYLDIALARDHAELWLNHNHPHFKSLVLLTNKRYQRAYIETKEEQSYDPDFTGEEIKADLRKALEEADLWMEEDEEEEETTVEFILSNGQADDIAVNRTAHLPDAVRAVEHFFLHGTLGPSVQTERNISISEYLEALDQARQARLQAEETEHD